jgi:hypothetical protein
MSPGVTLARAGAVTAGHVEINHSHYWDKL